MNGSREEFERTLYENVGHLDWFYVNFHGWPFGELMTNAVALRRRGWVLFLSDSHANDGGVVMMIDLNRAPVQ